MADKPNGKGHLGERAAQTALMLALLYPLSMGPVWWLSDHLDLWTGIGGGQQFTLDAPSFGSARCVHHSGKR